MNLTISTKVENVIGIIIPWPEDEKCYFLMTLRRWQYNIIQDAIYITFICIVIKRLGMTEFSNVKNNKRFNEL